MSTDLVFSRSVALFERINDTTTVSTKGGTMTQLDIAHIREQGQDMIIVPLDSNYGHKSESEQNSIRASLQHCAGGAGLRGTVVTVWDAGRGQMGFLAPPAWQAFFSGLSLHTVHRSLNKTLTCG